MDVVYAQRGCCSYHNGVAWCSSSGRQICNDGSCIYQVIESVEPLPELVNETNDSEKTIKKLIKENGTSKVLVKPMAI